MPNKPKTPNRTVRIGDEPWTAALRAADANGENLSDVIRQLLQWYALDHELWATAQKTARDKGDDVTDVVHLALQRYVRRAQRAHPPR